jgi:hypothetical protein
MKRNTKRIFIIFIYFSIAILFFGMLIAFLTPNPTCFDKKQNQGEEGVDCGGPCIACVEELVGKDLIVKDTHVVYGGENKYDVVATIQNPNPLYGGEKVYYTVEILDGNGIVLDKRDGETFILPNESKYIMEVGLETNQKPATAKVAVNDVKWIKFTEFDNPQIIVKNQRFGLVDKGSNFAEAFGLVSNDSPYDFHNVNVYVILKDERDIPVAINKTQMRTLNAGTQREFRLIWPHQFPGNIKSAQMQTETNIFDSLNFLKTYLPSGKYQELLQE